MPQLPNYSNLFDNKYDEDCGKTCVNKFKKALNHRKISYVKKTVDFDVLIPTQMQLDEEKVNKFIKWIENGEWNDGHGGTEGPWKGYGIQVTEEGNYIIDGHHRWAAAKRYKEEKKPQV